jgi:hypothetical protein
LSEAKAISEFLTKRMKIKFEQTKPVEQYPPGERLDWVVRYADAADVKISPYFNMIWADKETNAINLESVELGSSYTWVEDAYGEKGVIAFTKMNLANFANGDARELFEKRFPRVGKRLEMYERIIADVSSKTNVAVRMVYEEVSERIVEFRIGATVDARGLDFDSKKSRIEAAIAALKVSFDKIREYEKGSLV